MLRKCWILTDFINFFISAFMWKYVLYAGHKTMLAVATSLCKKIYIYIYIYLFIHHNFCWSSFSEKCKYMYISWAYYAQTHLFDMSGNKNPCHCSSALSAQVNMVVADSKRIWHNLWELTWLIVSEKCVFSLLNLCNKLHFQCRMSISDGKSLESRDKVHKVSGNKTKCLTSLP